MLTPILIASLAAPGLATELPLSVLARHGTPASPYVEVWANRDELFRRGDKVKVYFRTDIDAYVTLFRVDTDGRVRVLFPLDPWGDNYAVGGVRYQVDPRNGGYTFRVDDYPGQGYLFAVATLDPFVYSAYVRGDHWDYRMIGTNGRITGDPYVALGDLISAIVPSNYLDYSYDVVPYFVEERYAYPRFLCYDCHAYASYPYWNPYAHSCFSFRIVVYDDPYYYPARLYYGTRVVYQRPRQFVPKFVVKDRTPADPYVTTVRERPVDAAGRRRVDPGATQRDVAGGVLLPTPTRAPVPTAGDLGVRRLAPTTPEPPERRAGVQPVTPTLERRDPSRAPASEAGAAGQGLVAPRTPDPRRAPAEPERGITPARTERAPAELRRADPKREESPPRKVEPRRNDSPAAAPARAEPKRSESPPKQSEAPPKRRN